MEKVQRKKRKQRKKPQMKQRKKKLELQKLKISMGKYVKFLLGETAACRRERITGQKTGRVLEKTIKQIRERKTAAVMQPARNQVEKVLRKKTDQNHGLYGGKKQDYI